MGRIRKIIVGVAASAACGSAWAQQPPHATAETSGSVTVLDPAEIAVNSELTMAPVIRPQTGSRTAAAVGASYTLTGMGGETFNVSTPTTVPLTLTGGTEQIQLRLGPTRSGQVNAAPGAPGAVSFTVQGSAPVTSATPAGLYQGQFGLTIAYP